MLKLSVLVYLSTLVNCTDSAKVIEAEAVVQQDIEADLVKSLSNIEDDEEDLVFSIKTKPRY